MSEELSVLAGETEVLTKFSFPPIVGANARLLILGTLPGEESLRLQQYYGHPRNHFWPLIAAIFDKSLPAAYAERERLLKRNRSALWDVLESAERVGSLEFRDTQPDSKRVCKILRRLSRYPHNRLQRPEGALAFSKVCREAGRHSGKRFHLAGSAFIEPPLHQAIRRKARGLACDAGWAIILAA